MGLELERGGAEVAALAQELRVGECVLHDGGHVRRGVDHTHLAGHGALDTILSPPKAYCFIDIIQNGFTEFEFHIYLARW